jgi:branched-chain amino acid transport system substrate-binding protein
MFGGNIMKKKLSLVALLVLMVVVSACGNQGGSQEDTILIGVSGPISGTQAQYGEAFKNGAELAAKEINDAGGIDGKMVKIVMEDDKGEPNEAANVANKFATNKDILAVVGHFNSSATLAAAPIYNRNELVHISPASSAPNVTEAGEYTYRVITTDAFQAAYLAEWSKELGYEKVALIYEQSDFGLGLLDVYQSAAPEHGIEVVAAESYLPGSNEFSTILTKVKDKDPDAIFIGGFYNEAALIASQAKRLNLSVDYIGVDSLYSQALLELGGEAVEGFKLIGFFYPGGSNERANAFHEAYVEAYGKEPDTYAAYAYDATSILIEAIKQNGANREGVKEFLDQMEDFPGATGLLSFDENGDVQTEPQKLTVKDGAFVPYE